MTAAHLGIPRPRGFAFGPGRQGHLTTTPIYDALADEFRFALRTVPGDHGTEDRLLSALFSQHYNFSAVGRSGSLELGRGGSRHRGLPEHGTTQF
ncbi:MAG TPA: hypothetical protein VGX23_17450 [Actinocrinis sp.]|nr:hypothetical protein [Actinocrinis sp.]